MLRLTLPVLLLVAPGAWAASGSLVTSVYSKVSNGYQRRKLPDGTFQREYYALANGIYSPGVTPNRSIDAVKFPQVAKLVAQFLALQNYYLAPDAKSAEILLVITWGTTVPYDDAGHQDQKDSFYASANNLSAANAAVKQLEDSGQPGATPDGIQSTARSVRDAAASAAEGQLMQMQMFNDIRRAADERNARLLGYVEEINQRDTPAQFGGAGAALRDLVADLETERYYVIISAYDFHAAAAKKEQKLLWSTRVSIQAQGNKFNETLAGMLAQSAKYFGQDSGRLLRQYQPEGKVNLGELKVIGMVPAAEAGAEGTADKPQDAKARN